MFSAQELIRMLGLEPRPLEEATSARPIVPWRTSPAPLCRIATGRPNRSPRRLITCSTRRAHLSRQSTGCPPDETYHFYLGDVVELLLHPGGRGERILLGQNLPRGEHPQCVVPGGLWQGCRLLPGGRVALLGATMAPGYGEEDYQAGDRDRLMSLYPQYAPDIARLANPFAPEGGESAGS